MTQKRGRKPSTDKKERLNLYVPGSIIQSLGGTEEAKRKIYDWLQIAGVVTASILFCFADNFFN